MSLDLVDALRIFAKVAELGSFTRAAGQLGTSKARVSLALKALEAELGAQLLARTTRVVRLTPDGEELLPGARSMLLQADELASMFRAHRALRGRVRIDLPMTFALNILLPKLPELLARHPDLELVVSTTDRRVEPVKEGFDCVLRVGALDDSRLVARKLGALLMTNCASPAYLRKYGVPRQLEDLQRHFIVNYSSNTSAEPPSFEYPTAAGYAEWPMRSKVTVNSVDAYRTACCAGLGIIQSPRTGLLPAFADGTLVEILPEFPSKPLPVTLLHTHGRTPPPRVRVVLSWIADSLAPYFMAQER